MNRRSTPDYVLGTEADELDRLGTQHQIWHAHTSALWERAGFGPGQTLLDAGCGPGFATVDLAHLVGRQGQVIGMDVSAEFIANATARANALGLGHVSLRQADIQTAPLANESLDGAFMRWVVSFTPRPADVFRRIATALRPGAPLVLMDYFNYLTARMFPGDAVFEELFTSFAASNRASGGDYDNGGGAPQWARESGLVLEYLEPQTFLARPGDRYWNWFAGFCRVFAPKLEGFGLVDDSFVTRLGDAMRRHENDPAAFLMTPPVLALIARRPAGTHMA